MMVEKTPTLDLFTYAALILGIVAVCFPILYAVIAATLSIEDVSTESLTRNTDHDDQINHEEDDQDAFESQFPQVSLLFRNIYVQSPFLS